MTVCKNDLRFPVVDPVQLRLYKNSTSFAVYGYSWATTPFDVAQFAAKAQENKIHLDLDKLKGKGWAQITDLLAHEYGHVLQYALTHDNQAAPHWFKEGFADWLAAKVLDVLQWEDYRINLHRAELELLHNQGILTPLHTLDLQWGSLSSRSRSHIRTYTLAFVAMGQLEQLGGTTAILKYLKTRDFTSSFHLTLNEFEVQFDNYRSRLRPSHVVSPAIIEKPDWDVGYQWTYAVITAGAKGVITRVVDRVEEIQGNPVYVVKLGSYDGFYAKDTLERIGAMENGKMVNKRLGRSHDLSWPLTVGKTWQNKFAWENLGSKTKYNVDLSMVAPAIERVTVPAGTFDAAKIEGYDLKSGRLMAEYWYSPAVNWYIKTRVYDTEMPLIQEELLSFKKRQSSVDWTAPH